MPALQSKVRPGKSKNEDSVFVVQPKGLPQDNFKGPEFQSLLQKRSRGKNQFSQIDAPKILSSHIISCTSCLQQINPFASRSIFEHPVLHVILCKACHEYYHSGEFDKDEDGIDNYCRWCGDGGTVTVCENCCNVFCRSCIRRHVTRKEYNQIKEESWVCFVCDPTPIQSEIETCRAVLAALREYDKNIKTNTKTKKKVPRSFVKLEDIKNSSDSYSDEPFTVIRNSFKVEKPPDATNGIEPLQQVDVKDDKDSTIADSTSQTSVSFDDWKLKCTQQLEEIAKKLEIITDEFQSHFSQVTDRSIEYSKSKSVEELSTPLASVYSQAKKLNQVYQETTKQLQTNDDLDEDSSTTYKESDSDVVSSPSKRKIFRKRKELNSTSRLSSSNDTDTAFKQKPGSDSVRDTKNEPMNDGEFKPLISSMTGVIIKTEVLSSSGLSDTGSSKMLRKKITARRETGESLESISDIFDTSGSLKTKRKLRSSSSISDTNNSQSLLDENFKNENESEKKSTESQKKKLRKRIDDESSEADSETDVTNVGSEAGSDDQILPLLDVDGDRSGSNSALTDDAGIAAENNKIAYETLANLVRLEENEEDDLDEDVQDLLNKENKTNSKSGPDRGSDEVASTNLGDDTYLNGDNNDDNGDNNDDNNENNNDDEETMKKKSTSYKNPLLNLRIVSSESESEGGLKKERKSSKRRVSSGDSKDESVKKAKMELVCDEALKNPYLSDDDVRLLNKDADEDNDDVQPSDIDMLLSDDDVTTKEKDVSEQEIIVDSESRKTHVTDDTIANKTDRRTSEDDAAISNDEALSKKSKTSDLRTDGNTSMAFSDIASTAKIMSSSPSSDSDLPTFSIKAKKKSELRRLNIKVENMSSDDDADNFRLSNKSTSRNKKFRRKIISDSDEEKDLIEINNTSSEDDFLASGSSKAGRRNIRKIFDDTKVSQDTKTAEKLEMERRRRLKECDDDAEVIVIDDESSPVKKVVTAKLVLSKNPLVEVHSSIVRILKKHQIDGIKFLWKSVIESVPRALSSSGDGCILAHCMGLGKTLQVITFLHTVLTSSELPDLTTALIVCPLITVKNWGAEFRKWTGKCEKKLRVFEFEKSASHETAMSLKQWQRRGGIIILSYAKFRSVCLGKQKSISKQYLDIYRNCLQDPGPDFVICDEGHILKNEKTNISSVVDKIRTNRRIVLTGTPLQNNLIEYHCMVNFVKPRLLGSKKEFLNRFVNPILNGQHVDSNKRDVHLMKKRSHVLHELLSGCVQRRDVICLRSHLMPKFEYVVLVRLSTLQIRLYEHYMKTFQCDDLQGRKGQLFQDFNNFLLISSHPRILLLNKARQDEAEKAKEEQMEMKKFLVEEEDDDDDDEYDLYDGDDQPPKTSEDDKPTLESIGVMSISNLKKLILDNNGDCSGCIDKDDLIERATSLLYTDQNKDGEGKKFWFESVLPTQDELIKAVEHSGKMTLLLEILHMAAEHGDKVVVFSQSILTLDLIEIVLRELSRKATSTAAIWKKDWDYFRIDGSISSSKRNVQIDRFNSKNQPRARLFLISTRAGGIGINLVGANRAVIFDASWNPTHDVQSIFRIYRFGQSKPCYIYRLIAQGTMEEKIYDRQVLKQSLAFRVVDEHQIERHFTANDIQELYSFKPKPLVKKSTDDETPEQAPPKDQVLAELLRKSKTRDMIVSYHRHDSLLDHQVQEELTEEERRVAWDEYDRERHPPVKEDDQLMRLSAPALTKLLDIVKNELVRNEDFLKKCKERPLSDIMLNLKIQNRDLNAEKLQEHATEVLMFQTHLKKRLENARRVLLHKVEQLQHCYRLKSLSNTTTPVSSTSNTSQNSVPPSSTFRYSQPNVTVSSSAGPRSFSPTYQRTYNRGNHTNYTNAGQRYPYQQQQQQSYRHGASRFPPYAFGASPQQRFNYPYGRR